MNKPEKEYTPLGVKTAEVMEEDIRHLTTKARTDTKLYLSHPEWFDKGGKFLPPSKRIRGGLDHLVPAAHETLIPGAIEEIEQTGEKEPGDKKTIMSHINKIRKHVEEIVKARKEPDDKMQAAIKSHVADYEIEMRALRKFDLPEGCVDCLELSYHIATAPEHAQRKWHKIAQNRAYAETNSGAGQTTFQR